MEPTVEDAPMSPFIEVHSDGGQQDEMAAQGAPPLSDLNGTAASDTMTVRAQLAEMQAARDAAEAQHRELKQQVAMRQLAEQRRELFEMTLRVTELKQANERMLAAVAAPAEGPLHERPVPVNVMNNGIAPADSASQMGAPSQLGASHIGTKRRRYKDPTPYEGKTLKEATMFQTSLETIFAIDPITFETGREKVLYASTYLKGEPLAQWSLIHGANPPSTYTFRDFKEFIMDCVADPVNRSLDVGQAYEDARQREGQTVADFAMHLSTLEDQLDESYTETQRTRHLFNKLRPHLKEIITLKSDVPINRRGLIALAQRLENASRNKSHKTPVGGELRSREGPSAKKKPRGGKPSSGHPDRSHGDRRRPAPHGHASHSGSDIVCYWCGKKGHIATECKAKAAGAPKTYVEASTRKLGVSSEDKSTASKQSKKEKGLAKSRS
jgi:hypothetical protein